MMHRASFRVLGVLLFLTLAVLFGLAAAAQHKKVLLKDVNALTLSASAMTTGRRSAPVPQLKCVGGPCQYAPATVLCTNVGFDGRDVLWKAKADLEKGIKFGDISVVCEGYDYADDPYILYGSCGLEYTLIGYAEADKHHRHHQTGGYQSTRNYERSHRAQTQFDRSVHQESSSGSWFMWLFVAGIVFLLYRSCVNNARAASDMRGGGGGGGAAPFFGGGGPPGGLGMASNTWGATSCAPPVVSTSASSGPGFWSGMAAGGGLGYLMGRRSAQSAQARYAPSSSSSSWGSSSYSSPSPPASMSTSSSSAFGGTRRR